MAKHLPPECYPLNFLKPYTPEEAILFPGRPTHAHSLISSIQTNRWVILHGPTGCGKTSLIQAQVVPELTRSGFLPVFIPTINDPQNALISSLINLLPEPKDNAANQRPPIQIVADVRISIEKPLILIFDQFEWILNRYSQKGNRKILDSILRIIFPLASPDEPIAHLVLVVRNDFLPILAKNLPDSHPMDQAKVHFLPHLDRAELGLALEKFSSITNIKFTSDLISEIEKDFTRFNLRTIDLQTLLYKLYRDHSSTSNKDNAFSIRDYQNTGRAIKIIRDFLGSEIQSIANSLLRIQSSEQIKPQKRNAIRRRGMHNLATIKQALRLILSCFITSNDLSQPITRRMIVYQVLSEGKGVNRRQINHLIAALRIHGLILRLSKRDPFYELVHPALAHTIRRWFLPRSTFIKGIIIREKARRIIQDCMFRQRQMYAGEFRILTSNVKSVGFNLQELEWLFRSALLLNVEARFWYNRLKSERVDVSSIIQDVLEKQDFRTRLVIIKSLYNLGSDSINFLCPLLDDDYPQIRAAVVAALRRLDPSLGWHQFLKRECYIQGGNFPMGTNHGNFPDEEPQHSLYLPDFYIGKTPVTNQEFHRYTEDTNTIFSFPLGMERHPVVNINWYEAREYARWGSLRLPTEAEWEKAASWSPAAGSNIIKRRYPWGNDFDETKCNMRASKTNGTTRVGNFSSLNGDSAYGCSDMSGNVWEWTSSLFQPYPYRTEDGREDPSKTGSRVIRGGSYKSGATYATCTIRQPFNPYSKREDVGFRCVLDLPNIDSW